MNEAAMLVDPVKDCRSTSELSDVALDDRKPRSTSRADRRARTNRHIFDIELGAFHRVCEDVNTPRSLACYLITKYGEWSQYLELPRAYFNDDFPVNHGVTEMLRKNPRLPIAVDRKAVAIEKFLDSEASCKATNERFSKMPINSPEGLSDFPNLTQKVKRIIKDILGPLTTSKLAYAESKFRFGPGATSDISGSKVLLSNKMSVRKYGITPRLATFRDGFLWPGAGIKLCPFSKVTTVPKTALTDRTIAIEPHWNIYVQLGTGALIRRQLERSGLKCSEQTWNRQAAFLARKHQWATIDLSSASDTISFAVVAALLPEDWFELLYASRTDFVLLPGESEPRELEKFSSMGNGFTWELETLIFWAVARAVAQETGENEWDTLAFGDDIIVPAACVPLLVRALDHYGFKVNEKKSFWQGDFFESCGVDVFRHQDVRPCYFKGEHEDVETACIRIANAIRRYAHRIGHGIYCDHRYQRGYQYVVARSGRGRKTGIPEGYGDEGLVRNFDEVRAYIRPARSHPKYLGWEGWICKVLRRSPVQSSETCPIGAYNTALNWGTPELSRETEFARGRTKAPQLRPMVVSTWVDLGPWA